MNALSQAPTLYTVFQPLFQLDTGELFGHEALLRSTTNDSPEYLFRAARSAGRLYELDLCALKRAVFSYFRESPGKGSVPLFVNVFPSTLLHPSFRELLVEEMIRDHPPVGRIVLEINEASEEEKMWDIPLLGQKIREMRQSGFMIALDDVGSGAASLKKIVEYEPDFVKLDRYFGKQLAESPGKQKLVSLFVDYCEGQSKLVLEGIEQPEDLAIARKLGVPIGQGFLLGRPEILESDMSFEALDLSG